MLDLEYYLVKTYTQSDKYIATWKGNMNHNNHCTFLTCQVDCGRVRTPNHNKPDMTYTTYVMQIHLYRVLFSN